jgi:hypothetical protein
MELYRLHFLRDAPNAYDILFVGEAMARGKLTDDTSTLQMALVGYQIEKDKIEAKIKDIHAQLKGKRVPVSSSPDKSEAKAKRILSPAARKRIAAAQKKRWAEHRRRKAQAAKEAQ